MQTHDLQQAQINKKAGLTAYICALSIDLTYHSHYTTKRQEIYPRYKSAF